MSEGHEYLQVPPGLSRTWAYDFGGSETGSNPVPVLAMRVDRNGNVQVTFDGSKWTNSDKVAKSYGEWVVLP